MSGDRITRVIVGVDESVAGLRALRLAVTEARRRPAVLHAVRACQLNPGWAATLAAANGQFDRDERAHVARAFADAMGGFPGDITVVITVLPEAPGIALVSYAHRDDDLIFVGSGQRGWLRRLFRPSVSRYCAAHARCPVVVVPPDAFARAVTREGMARAVRRAILTG